MSVHWLHRPDCCHPQRCTQCQYADYTVQTAATHSTVHNVSTLTTPSRLLPPTALYTTCAITTSTHIISQFTNYYLALHHITAPSSVLKMEVAVGSHFQNDVVSHPVNTKLTCTPSEMPSPPAPRGRSGTARQRSDSSLPGSRDTAACPFA